MKTKIIGILVCMLLIATALPAVGTMNKEETPITLQPHTFNTEVHKGTIEANPKGAVLWDNGMQYTNFVSSQWDPTGAFEMTLADDFQFEETTVVTDVHWISGYTNLEDGDFDWNVSFYMDRGDGMAPGAKIYEQVFPNAEVHETFIEISSWEHRIFSYWVDLADAITFTGGEKYWISTQGIGIIPPQTMLACHVGPIVLHEGVVKSTYFGYFDWTNITELISEPRDFCFQLTGDGEPVVPDLDCDGTPSWTDVEPGAKVNSTITVINNGDVGSMLEWEVLSYPNWGTNWSAKWYYLDRLIMTDGGFVGTTKPEEIFVEVIAPDEPKETFTGEIVLVNSDDPDDTCIIDVSLTTPVNQQVDMYPLFQRILERFPNAFPILRHLMGL